MKNLYITKPDACGNVYRLTIDHTSRTFHSFGLFTRAEAVTVTHKKMREIEAEAKAAGYIEKY